MASVQTRQSPSETIIFRVAGRVAGHSRGTARGKPWAPSQPSGTGFNPQTGDLDLYLELALTGTTRRAALAFLSGNRKSKSEGGTMSVVVGARAGDFDAATLTANVSLASRNRSVLAFERVKWDANGIARLEECD